MTAQLDKKGDRPYYPRMTGKVRELMLKAEKSDLERIKTRGSAKTITLLLIWDGWLKIEEDMTGDIRLTPAGRAWLMRDRLLQVERGL
jgi:hypothetical protein